MAQAVSVFRWDDTSAPQVVDGKPSEYMTVLKKCLVEGYGATTSIQWIVVVDEILTATPFLVLKNDTTLGGSGQFIVFEAVDDTAGTNVKVQCCQAYVDKVNRINVGGYFAFNRGSTGSFLLSKWMLIGTETGFYFFVTNDYVIGTSENRFASQKSIFFWTGDFASVFENDPSKFITMSGEKNSNNFAFSSMLNYKVAYLDSVDVTDIYAIDGSAVNSTHSISTVIGLRGASTAFATEEPEIKTLVQCYLITGSGDNTNLNIEEMPFLRGSVPGLFYSTEAGYRQNNMPFFKDIGGVEYFQIPSAGHSTSMAWINTKEW